MSVDKFGSCNILGAPTQAKYVCQPFQCRDEHGVIANRNVLGLRIINGNPAAFPTHLKSAKKLYRHGAEVWLQNDV